MDYKNMNINRKMEINYKNKLLNSRISAKLKLDSTKGTKVILSIKSNYNPNKSYLNVKENYQSAHLTMTLLLDQLL